MGGGSASGGWKWDARKVKKRTERVFKGIPDRWRSAAWGTLAEERMVRPSERRTERVGLGELGRRYRVSFFSSFYYPRMGREGRNGEPVGRSEVRLG